MTGTIVHLTPGGRTGIIREEDGARVPFADTEVLGDFYTLTVGQRVSFDVETTARESRAVRILTIPFRAESVKKAPSPLDLRYMGFQQNGNIRSFHFDAVASGQTARRYVVTVDLDLLLQHRVGMQDAPALCLRKLLGRLADSPDADQADLTDTDLAEFTRARAAAAERKARTRPPVTHRRGAPPPLPGPRRFKAG